MRLIESALVGAGVVQPTIKAIADSIRDYPETFTMRAGRDNAFSWLTHTSRTWAVLRFDEAGQTLPRFRIINALGEETLKLGWWDRAVLAVSWPSHLEPRATVDPRGAILLGTT
jgi:hypothetical protein